ncbi:Genome sequencing data, contig C321 [Microcystis aeruginosa PCC 9717]|uniref:Genome sequencing data, contig C321 n=2 Tax=Microcystis aeruginosa TaxID=1126 RepID=I4FW37_MICAE|nr:Genome sequencing data, contig C321 [Microcystis aeruginosa PCC 9717]
MFDIKLMPKIVDVEQYRKELLLKSAELFAEKGYANMTTRELAQGLGVSTGTLYHYFPSKAALFEQLVEEMCREDVLLAKAEIDRGKTLTEKLKILGKFMTNREDYCIKQLFLWIDYSQYQGREELSRSQLFERVDRRYHQAVIEILGISDPSVAWLVVSVINGLILERLWCNEQIAIDEQMELLGKILTTYLQKNC